MGIKDDLERIVAVLDAKYTTTYVVEKYAFPSRVSHAFRSLDPAAPDHVICRHAGETTEMAVHKFWWRLNGA